MDLSKLRPKWTEYIPHNPTPKQLAYLLLPHREAFFGGAAGGGKSDALLMAGLQYCDVPGYAGIVFRKTLSDLKLPNSLLARAHDWLTGTPAKWVGSEHAYYFPTVDPKGNPSLPAKLVFGYIGQEGVKHRYQSAEFQFIAFDELTQHRDEDYLYMFSRLRRIKCRDHEKGKGDPNCPVCLSSARVPLRMRSASNPGNTGHQWVKERFEITGVEINGETRYVGQNKDRPYIPAFVADNPHLDADEYLESLDNLDPVTREQLKRGDWGISQDSRFRPDWFRRYSRRGDYWVLGPDGRGPMCKHNELIDLFFTIDSAASAKEGPGDDKRFMVSKSWTVIAVWGLTPDYNLLLLDVRRFRKEIPYILDEVKKVYRLWKPHKVYMEAVGTGKGAFQICLKAGLPMIPLHPHTDKVVRSSDAQVRAEMGKIWLPQYPGPGWLKDWEGEIFTWTGHPQETDDQVDTLSFAAQAVSWEASGAEMAEGDLSGNDAPIAVQVYPSAKNFYMPTYGMGF